MNERDKNILVISVAVILVAVAVFFIYRFKQSSEVNLSDFFSEPADEADIDFSELLSDKIFVDSLQDDSRFKQLKSYFIEVESGNKGRKNPFVK